MCRYVPDNSVFCEVLDTVFSEEGSGQGEVKRREERLNLLSILLCSLHLKKKKKSLFNKKHDVSMLAEPHGAASGPAQLAGGYCGSG